jgi:hypothetical protein
MEAKLLPAAFEWLEEMSRPDLFTEPGWLEGEAGEHILRLERETAEWQRLRGKSGPIEIRKKAVLGATIELTQSGDHLHQWFAYVSAWPDSDVEITIDTSHSSFWLGTRRVRDGFLARLFYSQLQKRGFRQSAPVAG